MNQKHNGLKFPCCAQGWTAQGECLAVQSTRWVSFPQNFEKRASPFCPRGEFLLFCLTLTWLSTKKCKSSSLFQFLIYIKGGRKENSGECESCSYPQITLCCIFLHHKALHNQWQNTEGLQIQEMDRYHHFLKQNTATAETTQGIAKGRHPLC